MQCRAAGAEASTHSTAPPAPKLVRLAPKMIPQSEKGIEKKPQGKPKKDTKESKEKPMKPKKEMSLLQKQKDGSKTLHLAGTWDDTNQLCRLGYVFYDSSEGKAEG